MTDEQTDVDAMKHALQEWRRAHPNATFREMERAVDEQIAELAYEREVNVCPGRLR